jgi:hypothetical protein
MKVHNTNVYKGESKIVCLNSNLVVGDGLFASKNILKGDVVCSCGGYLLDSAVTKYMDPTYVVSWELGKGFKLNGDNIDGDMGHYANSVHPENRNLSKNAKFLVNDAKKKFYKKLTHQRARFNVVATKDIKKDDEIIVDYGMGYWKTMKEFTEKG